MYGTERYPWLGELFPSRSATSLDCSACHGRGRLQVGQDGLGGTVLCPECHLSAMERKGTVWCLGLAESGRRPMSTQESVTLGRRYSQAQRTLPERSHACTFRPSPTRTVIVFSPLHSAARRSSNLVHELAYLLHDHELSRLQQIDGMSFLACDASQEEEADWRCGWPLLPRALLLKLVRQRCGPTRIAEVERQQARWLPGPST